MLCRTDLCVNEYDPLCSDYGVHADSRVKTTLIRLLTLGPEHERPGKRGSGEVSGGGGREGRGNRMDLKISERKL